MLTSRLRRAVQLHLYPEFQFSFLFLSRRPFGVKPPLAFSWTWTRSSRRCCLRLRNARAVAIPLLLRGGIDEDRTERKDIFLTLLFHAVVKGLLLVRGHRRRRCHLLVAGRRIPQRKSGCRLRVSRIASRHHLRAHRSYASLKGAHQPLSEDGSNAFDESRGEIFFHTFGGRRLCLVTQRGV